MGNASEQGQRGNVKEGSCAHVRVFVCACSLSSYFGANVFVHSHVSRLMFCVRCAVLVVQRMCVYWLVYKCLFVLIIWLVFKCPHVHVLMLIVFVLHTCHWCSVLGISVCCSLFVVR